LILSPKNSLAALDMDQAALPIATSISFPLPKSAPVSAFFTAVSGRAAVIAASMILCASVRKLKPGPSLVCTAPKHHTVLRRFQYINGCLTNQEINEVNVDQRCQSYYQCAQCLSL